MWKPPQDGNCTAGHSVNEDQFDFCPLKVILSLKFEKNDQLIEINLFFTIFKKSHEKKKIRNTLKAMSSRFTIFVNV